MSTPTISISGKQFVYGSESKRFMVRGIALATDPTLDYNLAIDDILANQHATYFSTNILPKLTAMNVNCIRVYQVDPNNQHNLTMNALEAAGIYVMVGLATSYYSVNQMTSDYTDATFVHAARVVDEFQAYSNTFSFSVGNEVEFPGQQAANIKTANPNYSDAQVIAATLNLEYQVANAMKSFARDIKAHISSNNYRSIPVGCAMQDGPQTSWGNNNAKAYERGLIGTDIIAQFYTAGKAEDRMDYIGINSYAFVSGKGQAASAYVRLANEASLLPVPVFLSEAGAVTGSDRDWNDVASIYNEAAIGEQLSGEVAFQMFEQGSGYGIYNVTTDTDYTATAMGGVTALTAAYAAVSSLTPATIATTPTSIVAPSTAVSPGSPPNTTPVYEKLTVDLNWPTSLLTAKKYKVPNGTAIISNFATDPIVILQQGGVIAHVDAAVDQTTPTTATISITTGVALEIQANISKTSTPNWIPVCGVPAIAVIDGGHYANNVSWGAAVTCNVYISVTNYATSMINIVQNGHVMGTVDAAVSKEHPKSGMINVVPGTDLLIQGPKPDFDPVCMVPGSKVVVGASINNDVSWSGTAVCNVS